MRAKSSLVGLLLPLLLVIGLLAGCSRVRSDAQIASDVQSRINRDATLQGRQLTVQAANGVVTLSGTVNSDTERAAAANSAAGVDGVKTIVNNLQVAPPAETAAVAPSEPAPAPEPTVQEPRRAARRAPQKTSGFRPGLRRSNKYNPEPADQTTRRGHELASNAPTDWGPSSLPVAPARPAEVTIPDGTVLSVRLIDPVDSERNHTGDSFRATLDSAITVGDAVVIPANADVIGKVTNAKSAAHFAGSAQLALELSRLNINGRSYELHTNQFSRTGAARGKNTAAKVGGGAALGALIGAIAGGGKGAAIGGAIGAGAGTTAQAATHGQAVKLTSEQVLNFTLEAPLTVTPVTSTDRDSRRQKLEVQ
ncbi:MAG: BON domain-containing protein [Terriglobales bacterium]